MPASSAIFALKHALPQLLIFAELFGTVKSMVDATIGRVATN
jgi:hypothetical protein